MNKIFVLACVLSISTPALAQSAGEKTGFNSLFGLSPSTSDFVKEAAISDMFEIQSSKLAIEKGDGPTKAFANQMVSDHEKTAAELKAMASNGKTEIQIPSDMDASHRSKLDDLKTANGENFIKQYKSDQVSAHKDAVSLFQRYAKGGENVTLKDWAGRTLPTLEHHLSMAESLDKQPVSKQESSRY